VHELAGGRVGKGVWVVFGGGWGGGCVFVGGILGGKLNGGEGYCCWLL